MFKKVFLTISILSLVLIAVVALSSKSLVNADDRFHPHGNNHNSRGYNPDNNLSKSACGSHLGKPVVDNVTVKVQNDADSGVTGNYWAFDYYTKTINAWQTAGNTYCVIVAYNGKFYAVPGQVSPQNDPSGALINTPTDQPVNGNMSGGYRATVTGTLLGSPTWPTHGNAGTFNYKCDINGVCPGVVSWLDQYFTSGYGFSYAWWGWKYDGGSHGTWINSQDGNSGNIQ